MNNICPHCEVYRDVRIISQDEEVTIKGKKVISKTTFYKCSFCNEEFMSPDQMNDALLKAHEEYDRLYS